MKLVLFSVKLCCVVLVEYYVDLIYFYEVLNCLNFIFSISNEWMKLVSFSMNLIVLIDPIDFLFCIQKIFSFFWYIFRFNKNFLAIELAFITTIKKLLKSEGNCKVTHFIELIFWRSVQNSERRNEVSQKKIKTILKIENKKKNSNHLLKQFSSSYKHLILFPIPRIFFSIVFRPLDRFDTFPSTCS